MASIKAGCFAIHYNEIGPEGGDQVIRRHGFPYDASAYDAVAASLAGRGYRCLIPYLRGYGPTRFLSIETIRSGQQAALGFDLLAFMDALSIRTAFLDGYDWGGRAACIVAALWPERVRGLVSCGQGNNIQDIANAWEPAPAIEEARYWYMYYFNTERGRAGPAILSQILGFSRQNRRHAAKIKFALRGRAGTPIQQIRLQEDTAEAWETDGCRRDGSVYGRPRG